MLLAGDVGGTTTRLGLFSEGPDRPSPLHLRDFATLDYDGLDAMVAEVLRQAPQDDSIAAACFGVAGPVLDGSAQLTNVPWSIDSAALARRFGIGRMALLNDLEAMAYSVSTLQPDELVTLQEGEPLGAGNAALIAAGTGLGEAFLHNIGGRFVAAASEAGHVDFPARTPRELSLVRALSDTLGRVRLEDVLSGPGLVNIHRVVHDVTACPVVDAGANAEQLPAQITASALERRCPACVDTLDVFASAYGAEAGNLALRSAATAGLYVGGGIAPRILPVLQSGGFMQAFRDKAPMGDLVAAVPVKIILHPQPGLLGAAAFAHTLYGAGRAQHPTA